MTAADPPIEAAWPAEERAGALLTIDLDAIAENYRRLRAMVRPGTQCAGVVKADGYGCGAVAVAKRLFAEGCRVFFVARAEEGFRLKPHLPEAEICVLDGLLPGLVIGAVGLISPTLATLLSLPLPLILVPVVFASFYVNAREVFGLPDGKPHVP